MTRHMQTYDISQLIPYISWTYFFHAWQVKDRRAQDELQGEALKRLSDCEDRYRAHAIVALGAANSDGDDILFEGHRLPMLRQQALPQTDTDGSRSEDGAHCFLSLADFVRPLESGIEDSMALFATSVDSGMETDYAGDDYEALMHKLLADRLAEAAAERMHEEVRKTIWGFAAGESLSISDMLAGRYAGIRPAVGYPSLPDMSMNFVLSDILGFGDIGITLTENGAMRPHASVSGLIIAHPQAEYFSVGRIGADQLSDYSRRRGVDENYLRKFLSGNVL